MDIFITGATGYIGFNVAKALRRAGHSVWGLTRSSEKTKMLAKEEIHAVIGNMNDPTSYRSAAERCPVLIHAAADHQNDTVKLDKKTVQTFIEISEESRQQKKIIYTSGCWIHGNTGLRAVDETTPVNPLEVSQWRPEVEDAVLAAQEASGIVIRPGCVYGKRGGLTGIWFNEAANENSMIVIGDGSNFWTMVHVDDLADAYVRIAEGHFSGEIFDISDHSRWTVNDMVQAVARATDYEDDIHFIPADEAAKEMGSMAEAMAVNQHVNPQKAINLLDWHPRHHGFVDDIETYFIAWKAHNS